ncbi:MAG: sigma factor-like helix-turn-helix DNA-binding protein [bacterium]|nr:sigma factor-like helix-turn-helix DNA-binding protein [bacterium]
MATITFKPKQSTKNLLSVLPDRARDVLISRYGLGKNTDKMTLDAIGKNYGITRERVRQIENYAIANIRKSDAYKSEKAVFSELETLIHSLGGIVVEEDFLRTLSKDKSLQNHINFLLVVGDSFKKKKEDDDFKHRWHVNEALAKQVEESLRKLYTGLTNDDLLPESEMVNKFLEHLENVSEKYKNQEIVRRWLSLSKSVDKNAIGEWGVASSPNIRTKGMRDYAFLVIRKHGSPIHFKEVAKQISLIFKKKAHVATTHNELIKDSRFVLVGRGLYALAEWGYMSGVVKDVISKLLEKHGPLTKEEIVDKVLKERYVKENTIMVNLQNQKHFKRDKEGRYAPVQ